jgi:hypothetical protein
LQNQLNFMAYNESTAERIRTVFYNKNIEFTEKKMFAGICFMVDDKMCCGTHIDKVSGQDFLLCRIGEEAYEDALEMNHVIPMEFTGRAMKGYVFVTGIGVSFDKELLYWIQKCIDYNPLAKKSKKENKKI